MNSTTTNSSSTIEIPAVTSNDHSASPRPVPPAPTLSGTRSGASRAGQPRPSTGGRCQHLFPNGKRCRKYATDSHFGLCLHHFTVSAAIGAGRQQDQSDFTDLSADLLPELSEFSAGTDIRQFLARLLTLVTKGRISPRRASVLAYITNQLLHSHRAIILETKADDDEPQEIIFDLPRPKRDWPDPVPPSHADMSWLHPNPEAPSSKERSRTQQPLAPVPSPIPSTSRVEVDAKGPYGWPYRRAEADRILAGTASRKGILFHGTIGAWLCD